MALSRLGVPLSSLSVGVVHGQRGPSRKCSPGRGWSQVLQDEEGQASRARECRETH